MGYTLHTVGVSLDGLSVQQANSTATNRGFDISSRDVSLTFPVPTFRPTTTATNLALDLMPRGTVSDVANNGVTWLDICSADIRDDNTPACVTARVGCWTTHAEFGSRMFNGATAIPFKLTVQTAAGTYKVVGKGTANGSFAIGEAALATNATTGFLYIPSCAGTPIGTPETETGTVATVYDTTNNKLYVYNGAWKSVTLA